MNKGLQLQLQRYSGILDCVRKVVTTEGKSGLFKGAGASILMNISGAFLLVSYDKVKSFIFF